ncbi:receptor-type tyrosine-protein phosphatase alpha [Aplysia californica]|uniref:Receptor-type tyrosine-protein phosphatase alpha n=1 Tax=Aplysia californica TaxID=6500 RepID=A0ABM1VWP7_APLCA|nr:receptor-type tyrosine-protein phosphatase alpha [Aplysia californica]
MKECHCLDSSERCDSILGRCRSGCAKGWTGSDCQTPVPCFANRYGWECGQICQCQNPKHCDRFLGPMEQCRCRNGFFNPPFCEPVTAPRFVFFENQKVNPGQPSLFNCTVAAFPTPYESEIRLLGPEGKRISLKSSETLDKYLYTRTNIFHVNYVMNGERYTCSVQATAGSNQLTMMAEVYELPRLSTPPKLARHGRGAHNMTLVWPAWDDTAGDTGEGPILWYSVHVRHERDTVYTLAAQHYHTNCQSTCDYTIKNLKPNSKYAIYVSTRRVGEGGDGPPGPIIHVRTKCDEPQMPPDLKDIKAELQFNKTYPKTRIIVQWEDPKPATINCNRIQKYMLYLSTEETPGGTTRDVKTLEVSGSRSKTISVPNLVPFTQYCVVMAFENDAGRKSPESKPECVVTPQTTPGAPENFEVRDVGSNKATLIWQQPSLSYGQVTHYLILYWEGEDETAKGSEWNPRGQTEAVYTLSGLKASTYYRVEVQAVNGAGPGTPTRTQAFSTLEGVPGEVGQLRNISRTASRVGLRWEPPEEQNGELVNYVVECGVIQSLSNGLEPPATPTPMLLPPDVLEVTVKTLLPATEYLCSVSARTQKGDGSKTEIKVWTSAEVLSPPLPPEIAKVTENTVTLKLQESNDRTISHYRIVVEKLDSKDTRKKRRAPNYITELSRDFVSASKTGEKAYVTAQFPPHRLRGTFTVGDNRTYDGYFNGPLQQDQKYNLWLGAFSNVDGKQQHAFVKADRPIVARSVAAASPTSSVPIIVACIIVFLLVIAIFVVLFLIWRRRHIAEEREKADMPSFGPTILPEPETSTPPTPIDRVESVPLMETVSTDILLDNEPAFPGEEQEVAPIKVEDLWDYIRAAKQSDLEGLKREYKLLPAGITATCEVARKNENKLKNRYGNIIAYDHSRVVLDPEDDDEHDDYINANYIDGYNKQRAYIAAQGPNKPTINDLWRMVWKENSKTLIMLTNPTESGKKKCEQYWPEEGCEQYGNISVQLLDTDVMPDFTVRTFLISKGGQSKYVKQFHYTTWPDHGVPRFGHSLLLFRQKIRAYDSLDNGTVVIHCSAGVGRTGTYISVDTQLERAKSEGIIDVHNFVQHMRTQRVNMVQTLEQYVFVYDCLLEALICGDTTVSSHAFPEVYTDLCLFDADINKTKLEEQFEILKLLSTTIERDESTTALRPENIFKNRCKNIIPANRCRPFLMTAFEGCNDYINAVFLNSYCQKDQLLVTQMPLPNTVVDFWRLVYDHGSYCIVMLNEVETNDDTCEQYWSEEPDGAEYGPFQVETTSEIKSNPIVTVRDFTVTNTQVPGNAARQVRQFHFHRWQEGSATPSSQRALLELVDMVNTWLQTQDGPITVHCMNGASRSGLFCAALTILERVQKEKEVDVFQAVKQLRLNRTQLIDNMEQYRFCHELVMESLSNPDAISSS